MPRRNRRRSSPLRRRSSCRFVQRAQWHVLKREWIADRSPEAVSSGRRIPNRAPGRRARRKMKKAWKVLPSNPRKREVRLRTGRRFRLLKRARPAPTALRQHGVRRSDDWQSPQILRRRQAGCSRKNVQILRCCNPAAPGATVSRRWSRSRRAWRTPSYARGIRTRPRAMRTIRRGEDSSRQPRAPPRTRKPSSRGVVGRSGSLKKEP